MGAVINPGWEFRLMTVITLTAGTAFIMWLGEQITEKGIRDFFWSGPNLRGFYGRGRRKIRFCPF